MERLGIIRAPTLLVAMFAAVSAFKVTTSLDPIVIANENDLLPNALVAGATLIQSSLDITTTSINPASYGSWAQALEHLFGNVTEIRGYLRIQDLGSQLTDLSFFKSLRVVGGLHQIKSTSEAGYDQDAYTIVLLPSTVTTSVALPSLRQIVHGGVAVHPIAEARFSHVLVYGNDTRDGFDYSALTRNATLISAVQRLSSQHGVGRDIYNMYFTSKRTPEGELIRLTAPTNATAVNCHPLCNGRCYKDSDASACQFFCSAKCGLAGCQEEIPRRCCSATCLGGCVSAGHCHACAEGHVRRQDGTCSLSCPPGELLAGASRRHSLACYEVKQFSTAVTGKAEDLTHCTTSCPIGTAVDNATLQISTQPACVVHCPGGEEPINGVCPAIGDDIVGKKVCRYYNQDQLRLQSVLLECQVQQFGREQCDYIYGPVAVSEVSGVGLHIPEQTLSAKSWEIMGNIKAIHGILSLGPLQRSDVPFYGLERLTNGAPSSMPFSIMVFNSPGLTSVALHNLRSAPARMIAVFGSSLLCYIHNINLNELDIPTILSPKMTKSPSDPREVPPVTLLSALAGRIVTAQEDVNAWPKGWTEDICRKYTCHSNCGSRPCWSSAPDGCQRCQRGQYLYNGTCVSACPSHTYIMDDWLCAACDNACLSCSGPSARECTACASDTFLFNYQCRSSCPSKFYDDNGTVTCRPCADQCATCTGSSNEQCPSCSKGHFLQPGVAMTCKADCPKGFYPSASDSECHECPRGCTSCLSAIECSGCESGRFLDIFSTRVCVSHTTCSLGITYEEAPPTNITDRKCKPVTQCRPGMEYINVSATLTSDRRCDTCRSCDNTKFQRQGGTCNGRIDATCELRDRCIPQPCANGAKCFNFGDGFHCTCTPGYCGDTCENQLQSGGSCAPSAPGSSKTDPTQTLALGLGGSLAAVLMLTIVIWLSPSKRVSANMAEYIRGACGAEWMIERSRITTLTSHLGFGHFSVLSKGLLQSSSANLADQAQPVTVKQLDHTATVHSTAMEAFFHEMTMLIEVGNHTHVLGLIGVSCSHRPLLMVLEAAELGSLHTYLQNEDEKSRLGQSYFSQVDMLNLSMQIASGLAYLAEKRVVHRDLAARNVLLGPSKTHSVHVKIANFGFARALGDNDSLSWDPSNIQNSFATGDADAAVEWQAPEAIVDNTYLLPTDVWSFGVLLWEMFSFASTPYTDVDATRLYAHLARGNRLAQPAACPDEMYWVMRGCWRMDPDMRPKPQSLLDAIQGIKNRFVPSLSKDSITQEEVAGLHDILYGDLNTADTETLLKNYNGTCRDIELSANPLYGDALQAANEHSGASFGLTPNPLYKAGLTPQPISGDLYTEWAAVRTGSAMDPGFLDVDVNTEQDATRYFDVKPASKGK